MKSKLFFKKLNPFICQDFMTIGFNIGCNFVELTLIDI